MFIGLRKWWFALSWLGFVVAIICRKQEELDWRMKDDWGEEGIRYLHRLNVTVNADLSLALCVRIVSRDINCKREEGKGSGQGEV